MVAIFTGSGTGFERGSGNVLGSSGLLGSSGFGRSGSQVFLNAANGNLLINRQDEFLVGRGPDAGVARTYNSLGNMSDDNGDNWRQSTQRAVRLNGTANSWGSSVTHRMGDGSEVAYYWNGSAYIATGGAGVHDKIINIDGSVLRWTDGNSGIVETYESDGITEWRRLKTVADTSGNAVTYGYTGDKLTSIATADGGTITYSWTGSHITQVNSGDGTLTRYFYDSYDRLERVDVELTGAGSVYSTSYTYHGSSKLIATISETDGSSVSIGYDNDNRVTSLAQIVSTGVTRTTSLLYGEGYTSVTDPAGQVTTLSYDWTGALVQITAPPAQAGAAQQTVTFGYNEDGDLGSVTDALGQVTTYVRDSWGRVVTQTDRLDNITERIFNAAHKLLTETRPGSGTTRYVYDSLDRLVYVITPEGRVTRNWYNAEGQLFFISDFPDYLYDLSGFATDEAPTQAQVNDWCSGLPETASSEIMYMRFDERGNVEQRRQASRNNHYGSQNTAGGYSDEFFTYDTAGRLLTRRVEGQNTESFVYDGLGRITASTDLNGGTTSFVFNDAQTQTVMTLANGFVQTSTYNKAGELVGFTESGSGVAGGTAVYQYDALGRLRVMTDASGLKSYYLYDQAGRKVAEAHGSGTFTEFRYDANNRMVATIRYGLGNSGAQVALLQDPNSAATIDSLRPVAHAYDLWSWNVYDKEGRVVEAIEGDGSATTYTYDAAGRLVQTKSFVNKLTPAQIATFKTTAPASMTLPTGHVGDGIARIFYDKDGYAIGALDGEGYLTCTIYDKAGRKVQEIAYATATDPAYRATGSLQDLIDGAGTNAADRSTRYVYDGQGLLRFTIDALNRVTEFGYGSDAEAYGPVRQMIQYAGALGALSSYTYANVKSAVAALASDPANRTSWSVYDVAGRLAYSIDAGGAVIGYSYDNRGQITGKVAYATLRATLSLPTKAMMDGWAGTPSEFDRLTRYYYNARGELRFTVDAEGYVTRTDYDAEGRVAYSARWDQPITATDSSTLSSVSASVTGIYAATSWTYDDAGRLATITDPEGSVRHYYYYGNGKLGHEYVAEGQPDQSRTMFTYDQAGRLAARYDGYEGTPGFALTTFAYDGLGNLVSTTDANGHVTSWTYDKLGRKLSEANAASGVTSFEYNGFGDLVRTIDARLNSTWNYYDKLGRIETTRDAEDYVTKTAYTVFGEVASVTRRYEKATNTASVTAPPAVSANAKDATTSFTYDKLGRVKVTTDAESHAETNVYNAFGEVTQTQGKLGLITDFKYNKRGLVESEYVNAPVYDAAGSQVAAGYYRNKFEYYASGNVKRQIEADGLAERRDTVFTYDKAGRLTLKEGTPVAVGQAGTLVTPAEHYAYDERGNLIETWDAAGGHAWYWYDDLDRKSAEIIAVTATQGTYSAYSYDAAGNLKSSKVYGGWASLPASAGGTQPAPPAGEYRETSFDYDNINRLLSESVAGQAIGYWQNGSYVYTSGTLTTSYQYDAIGNVVKTTDPNLVSVYSYYDKLGRKTSEVDALGYLTTWERDAEGNVVEERRYSDKATGVSVAGRTAPAETSADRVTKFEYDRMGRRLKEKRLGVESWTLDTATGQLVKRTGDATTSTIEYRYNGLGQVTHKIEATEESTGNASRYFYDGAGRLTSEHRAGYVDFADSPVMPTVRYYYDALENLVRTEQGGASASGADRVTTNSYGAGGRLLSTTDAANNVRNYIYDAAGRKAGEYYLRDLGNGTSATEGLSFDYDRAGNLTREAANTIANGTWTAISYTTSAFNAYGEMIIRGTNGGAQEQFAYDGAGRLIRTNSGDGVWRHFVYDAVGRQTLVIESEGMDLSGMTQAAAYDNASTDGVNATVTVYDKRGQATSTIQRLRETAVGGTRQDIAVDRGYNAFGELLWEEDAYDRRTDYTYNTMGRVTQIQRPTVSVTAENGTQSNLRPTEKLFYDISGRLIGTQDANSVQAEALTGLPGYKTTRQLLAGTGYGGGEAMVVKEWHPDGGIVTNGYDSFGDLVDTADELSRHTLMAYDKLGRLAQVTKPGGLDEYYSYDLLGNRIGHWNEVTGYAARERTEYDAMGRVTKQVAFGGDTTTTSYNWSSGIATWGMGTFGGWSATTTYENGLSATEYTDVFGHVAWKSDLGGHSISPTYDLAGRMIGSTTSGAHGTQAASYAWLSNGQVGTVTTTGGGITTIQSSSYDKNGNKLTETTTRNGDSIQHAHAEYDALGRLTRWYEEGSAATASTPAIPFAELAYEYDANSNIRRRIETASQISANNTVSSSYVPVSRWFAYDMMNRMTVSDGTLSGGVIERGGGQLISYDAAGQRVSVSTMSSGLVWSGWKAVIKGSNGQIGRYADEPGSFEDGYIWSQSGPVNYSGKVIETYSYDADGRLATVSVAGEGGTAESGWPAGNGVMGSAVLRASYGYDAQGRLASQIDYAQDGATVAYSRSNIVYDAAGRVTSETVAARQTVTGSMSATTTTTYTTYGYGVGAGAGYALGAVVTIDADTWQGGSDSAVPDTRTTYGYDWFDGAVQSSIEYRPDMSNSTIYNTGFGLTGSGQVASASIADGRPRSVAFTLDAYGQAVRRDEADNNTNLGDPHQVWYRFNGRQMGTIGNDTLEDNDYAGSIAARQVKQGTGPFRNGQDYGGGFARFGEAYVPYTSYAQGSGGGSYTADGGETLSQLAAQIWGDAGLWYLLAEANGMAGDASLIQGQAITIPQGVTRNSNTATTFKPFDPAETLGNLNPTTPKPQKKAKNCGAFGAIIIAVVAVAVATIATAGAASLISGQPFGAVLGAMTGGAAAGGVSTGAWIAGGAVGGMVASAASQGVAIAAGMQSQFDWKAVAMGGVSGAIGGALGAGGLFKEGAFSGIGSKVGTLALRGLTANALGQGVGVATGLQSKFDFAGVAAAGMGALAGASIGGAGLAGRINSIGADALASAGTRSVLTGTDFGDNLIAVLPDVVARTLGAVAEDVTGGRRGPIDLLAEVRDGSYSSPTEIAGVGPAIDDEPVSPEEAAEIVVTARRGVSQFRSYMTSLPLSQQALVRKGLTQGTPAPDYIVPRQSIEVPGYGDILGGPSDPTNTLAGAINENAFFTASTGDDLAGWLFKAKMLDQSDDGIVNMIERLDWETDGNDPMLAGNIAALHATGDPTLVKVAMGLEEVAAGRWHDYGAAGSAEADRAVEEIVRLNPVVDDILLARDAIQGKASRLDIGVAVGSHVPVVGVVGKLGGRIVKAESRIGRAVRVGREGESLAGIVGSKAGFVINGRMRFPDEVAIGLVKEVKNVKYQGWTRQLKDYADFARQTERSFELWVGKGTTISRVLKAAERRGDVTLRYFGK